MTRVLVVDDDPDLVGLLTLVLTAEGYEVQAASTVDAALAAVTGDVDLVVLDIGLGAGDGRFVLSQIRATADIPVVMISGRGETEDRVLGLRLGADDYLAKPFSPVELVARVESVLRRLKRVPAQVAAGASPVEAGGVLGDAGGADPGAGAPGALGEASSGVVVDDRSRDVTVDGRRVELTAREFDLLLFLVRSPRQVFTRSQLLEQVWESRSEWQGEATVTEHIRRIRRKIEDDPDNPRWVCTVRGVGYRFVP